MRIANVLALAAIAALVACHQDSNQAPPPKAAAKAKTPAAAPRGPTVRAMTAGMVEAASQGKSQAPVTVKFELLQRPAVGQPLEISLALLPQVPGSPATIAVIGGDGLQLAPGDSDIEIPAVEAAQVYLHTIKVTPTEEGVLFLNLKVSLKHDDGLDYRSFSVPLIVAAGPANTANRKP